MSKSMIAANAIAKGEVIELGHIEFAQSVLANRRNAVGLTVQQISQMASAILVLDQRAYDAEQRICTMMADSIAPELEPEKQKPSKAETVYVAMPKTGSEAMGPYLEELVAKAQVYESLKFSGNENLSRQKFEKAALALAKFCITKRGK